MIFAGCSTQDVDEPIVPAGQQERLGVVVDDSEFTDDSRATVNNGKVSWQAGDQINVNGKAYTLQGNAVSGWYLDVDKAATYTAVYPASAYGTGAVITLPAVQTYTAGSPDAAAHIMSAVANSGQPLAFKNACSIVKLSFTGTPGESLVKIWLTGDNSEKIAGKGTLGNDANRTYAVQSSETTTRIALDCGSGIPLSATAQDFYVVVPAINFTSGFSIELQTTNGMMTKSTPARQTVRSQILNMPTIAVSTSLLTTLLNNLPLFNLLISVGDTNLDGKLSIGELSLITSVDLSTFPLVTSLTGIRYLPNLSILKLNNKNLINNLDVSSNTKLTVLECSSCSLASLNVSYNKNLTSLICNGNNLTALDVTKNTLLTTLNCSNNRLTTLDISKCPLLSSLLCYDNRLTTLDASLMAAPTTFTLTAGKQKSNGTNISTLNLTLSTAQQTRWNAQSAVANNNNISVTFH